MTHKFLIFTQNILDNTAIEDPIWNEKLVTILSIALITLMALLALNLFKVNKLKKEIKRLKNN